MSDAPHALIAGAGIGGLTAALCLARAGFQISLFERAKVLQEVGAGLQISPNASAILRDLGVLPHVTGALSPQALNIRRGRDGTLLQSLPLRDAERRWGAPYLFIHRADLHKALLETVRRNPAISVTAETEITGFFPGKDSIEVETRANGGTQRVKGACLIGADGLRSAVRRELSALQLKARGAGWPTLPAHARHLAWRTLVDANDAAAAFRRPESTLWLGPKAHIVNYPLREGSVINVIAVVEAPVAIDWNADIWSQTGAAETIAARFQDWSREVRELIGAARDWRTWPLAGLDPLPEWTSGRVALLGDAAHPDAAVSRARRCAGDRRCRHAWGDAVAAGADRALSCCLCGSPQATRQPRSVWLTPASQNLSSRRARLLFSRHCTAGNEPEPITWPI